VEATKNKKIGVLATTHTVKSQSFVREITKLLPEAQVYQEAAPQLVPLLEDSYDDKVLYVTEDYIRPILSKGIDTLILGCTHYSLLTSYVRHICGQAINVISQDEILPQKLKNYLDRHPEVHQDLISDHSRQFLVTMGTPNAWDLSYQLFEGATELQEVSISNESRFR
jgi:glutamate racemase